jgi:hypothetical protein
MGGINIGNLFKTVVTVAAIAAVAWTGQYYLLPSFTTAFSTYVVGAAVLSAATFTASSLLAQNPSQIDFTNSIRGQLVNSKSPTAAAKIIYGQTRVGGSVLFLETTGSTNQTLYQVAAVAGHEIQAFDEIYLNDDLYQGSYKGKAGVFDYATFMGADNQTASAFLSGTSAATYTFKGIACLISKLEYNQDVYIQGVPNITVVVRGKKVFDPRSANTSYSNNAALCIRDYLTDTKYGMSVVAEELDDASFIAAANICDQQIRIGTDSPAQYEKRYTINGVFGSDEEPKNILKKMLTACGGMLSFTGGKWTLKVAAYRSPSITLTEDDIVGDINMQASQSKRDIFNSIKGVFSSSQDLYQPISFPSVTNALYISEDGEQIWKDVEYPFTTSYSTCQRLAKIELEKARQQIIVNISCNLKAFGIQPADNILLTFPRYGWENKLFEVINWEFSTKNDNGAPTPIINLVLKETSESVYDWNGGEETTVDPSPNTNLPNAFQVNPPTNVAATTQAIVLQDGSVQSAIIVTWNAPVSSFVTQYEVQYIRGSGNQDWGLVNEAAVTSIDYGLTSSSPTLSLDYGLITQEVPSDEGNFNSAFTTVTNYTIVPAITDVEYSIRVRAINAAGVRSAFATLTAIPQGDTTPAGLPENINIYAGYKQLTLTWTNPNDADFDFVEVFRNTVNNQLTSTRAGVIRASIFVDSGLGINQTIYYWLRSVDRSGNRSAFTTVSSATTEFIDSDQFSQEVMNLFAEAGAYGIEPVSSLPAVGDFDGQIKFNTTENKLYRWDATLEEWTDDIFSIEAGSVDLASFAAGLEPISIVNSLPSASGYTGAKIVYLTTDGKLYRYSSGAWTTSILAADISGTLASGNFSTALRPVEVVSSLPSTDNFVGRTAVLTTDGKLYRFTSTGWTSAVPSADITGTLTNAQIAAVAASKVTGTLTSSQIADLAAAKITGQITGTQITDNAISTAKLNVGAVTADKITASSITADKIASNAVTAAKIEAGAVTTAKLAVGAVTASTIAANTITAEKIAANTITAGQIAANSITAGTLAAGAVTADKLAANSVTAGVIAAGAITTAALASNVITSDKIRAGAIQTDKIAANSITGGLIAASGVITIAAQISDGLITNAKIQNGAITTAKIVDGSITNAKIGTAAIQSANIGDAAITFAKIGTAQVNTLSIAGNAVTTALFFTGTSNITFTPAAGERILVLLTVISNGQVNVSSVNFSGYNTSVSKNGSGYLNFKPPIAIAYQSGSGIAYMIASSTISFYDTGSGSAITYAASTGTSVGYSWAVFILKR